MNGDHLLSPPGLQNRDRPPNILYSSPIGSKAGLCAAIFALAGMESPGAAALELLGRLNASNTSIWHDPEYLWRG